jgi:RNA polymerase sigma-70 factor (ECF subfamily)
MTTPDTENSTPENHPSGSSSRHPAWRDAGGVLIRHRNGDQSAFRELLEKMQKPIYSYLVRSGLQPEAAETVFQDIFVRVHESVADYHQGQPFQPWLFRIAAKELRSAYRSQRISRLLRDTTDEAKGENPDETLLRDSWVDRALLRLPFFQREVVLLCSTSGMRLKNAAESLDLSVSATRELLKRSHLRLATMWAAEDLQGNSGSIWQNSYCRKLRNLLTEQRTSAVRENSDLEKHLRECSGCFSFLEALQEIESHLQSSPFSGPRDLVDKTLARVVYAESRQMRAVRDSLLMKAERIFIIPGREVVVRTAERLGRLISVHLTWSSLFLALLSMGIGAAAVFWLSPR